MEKKINTNGLAKTYKNKKQQEMNVCYKKKFPISAYSLRENRLIRWQ